MLEVREDEALADVLLRMQRSRLHLASVVDDGRRTVGLVSLEDVLESIVGDIRDESDTGQAGPGLGRRWRSAPTSWPTRSEASSRLRLRPRGRRSAGLERLSGGRLAGDLRVRPRGRATAPQPGR